MLNQYRVAIAMSALRKAQDNYNKKLNEAIANATKDASLDLAQYMCQILPTGGGAGLDNNIQTPLNTPYAISYDVGSGLDVASLTSGGKATAETSKTASADYSREKRSNGADIIGAMASGGISLGVDALSGVGQKSKVELPGGTRETWATFDRTNRVCHFCSSTVTKNCSSTNKRGFLGIGAKQETKCDETPAVEKCEDIQM